MCACVSFFVHWEGERKSNDGKSDSQQWFLAFSPLIVAENSLQTLYSIDCQCINRRKSSRVVRHFKFSAYYVMITYLYDALSFLKHFLTFQLLNIIATVVLDHGVSVFKKCHQINVSELKVTWNKDICTDFCFLSLLRVKFKQNCEAFEWFWYLVYNHNVYTDSHIYTHILQSWLFHGPKRQYFRSRVH